VTVIHAVPAASAAIEIVEQALLPFDFAHFKVVPRSIPPIKTLPGAAPFRARRGRCLRRAVSFAAENKACSAASRRTSARHSSSENFSNRRPFAQIDCSRLRERWHAVSGQARRCEWRFAHRGYPGLAPARG
jgi:hypothetical protein